ncbi:metal dependent phosphohydrolase [Syntrophobotulus glycolicus DSM 8271]|uniref:Metal dependent phosphohydrolase n=1 Tax=Syntrophobotulus glycolicus (strain DSM 8271 / FlGlyR) TaxID=645991 RepID=F0T2H7_SYNGF|nr:HD domain-containing protein [Syntrophobotulus glycolicus]ADY55295.1 metal dependent phosphohydrolase [Syntrophobotulus glycolicus DSM 8271]
MNPQRFHQQIEFLAEIDKVKRIDRNTVLMDASRKENDAEHSWHMAVAVMLLLEYFDEKALNLGKVFKMVLLHDIVEIDAGDVFAYGNADYSEKAEREKKAAKRIFGLLPQEQCKEFLSIWNEYEECVSGEAKFAQALDSFMPILHNYRTKGLQWRKLGVTSDKVLARNRCYPQSRP